MGGRLGEIFGQGRVFEIGAVVFRVASAACGFAESEAFLITARAIQGLGAALHDPGQRRHRDQRLQRQGARARHGDYAGISMIFLALGPLVGGLLTEGWTWRAVFWINIPVGVVMLALAAVTLPRDERDREARFDWPGTSPSFPAWSRSSSPLCRRSPGAGARRRPSPCSSAEGCWWSCSSSSSCARWPLVAPGLFRSRSFTVDNVVLGLVQFALTGITVFGAIYVQDLLGFTPIEAGLSLLPLTLPLLLLAPRAGRIYDRVGPRVLVAAGAALLGGRWSGPVWCSTSSTTGGSCPPTWCRGWGSRWS